MKSKAQIADHPLHPMLIVVPAGAFILSLVFDVVHVLSGAELWWHATKPVMLVGVIGALAAAVPGLIDLVKVVPKAGATRTGVTHMALNLVVVALFAANAWLRWGADGAPAGADLGLWLTVAGTGILTVSGWLGWKMVYEYHIGVVDDPIGAAEHRTAPERTAVLGD